MAQFERYRKRNCLQEEAGIAVAKETGALMRGGGERKSRGCVVDGQREGRGVAAKNEAGIKFWNAFPCNV
jgi:hypothetical protein